jgi:hypothetical protein
MAMLVLSAASVAVAGPNWNEVGDAGKKGNTAQVPTGPASLNSISGSLSTLRDSRAPDFEDMYLINISNPSAFMAVTDDSISGTNFNAQLWLFDVNEHGLLAADDNFNGQPLLLNSSNDGTNVVVDMPGLYYLAISGFNNDPVSLAGLIFNQEGPNEISGPDGPGGALPHEDWTGTGETGNYTIFLQGVSFAVAPEPASLTLMLAGFVLLARRRR